MARSSPRRLLAAFALTLAAATAALAQHGARPLHGRFEDAGRWAHVFDDPARDAWQKPDEVIRALALAPDAAVADIGAGTGYRRARVARDRVVAELAAAGLRRVAAHGFLPHQYFLVFARAEP
ncbi:MAG: hypothetical protein KJ025_19145 [Burkholderiales bacterium]|nr:hypothetical protein [Burkholderiales bacterium]